MGQQDVDQPGARHGSYQGLIYHQYVLYEPLLGFLEVEQIKTLSPVHIDRLMEHALVFACLAGNSFGRHDQYLPHAYANLWNNGELGDIPNLYQYTASEVHYASVTEKDDHWEGYQSHYDFIKLGEEGREAIRKLFKHKS